MRYCGACQKDHPDDQFGQTGGRPQAYCKSAYRVIASLQTWYTDGEGKRRRKYPGIETVRAIMASGAGNSVTPAKQLRSAGHVARRMSGSDDPEVAAALGVLRDARGQRQGRQGYVYLIIEVRPGGGLEFGKVGYSTNPWARVAELQTGNPRPLKLHVLRKGTLEDERRIQQKYIDKNVLQEWFYITKELLLEFDLDENGKPFSERKK